MKSPFTAAGQPLDYQERWAYLEKLISGPLEARCLAIIEHCLLGCALCRDEEMIALLLEKRVTPREALLSLDVLSSAYVGSAAGQSNLSKLAAGKWPLFVHGPHGPCPVTFRK